jgi:alkylation response protein AidB-like acyl-CoA dehydrogenase
MLRSINSKLVRSALRSSVRPQSTTATSVAQFQLFNPTDEHASLRTMLREFVEKEVDPQALEHNRKEKFNVDLFRKLGDLGLLGITVENEFGGSGMDAVAAVIAHGKFKLHFCIIVSPPYQIPPC